MKWGSAVWLCNGEGNGHGYTDFVVGDAGSESGTGPEIGGIFLIFLTSLRRPYTFIGVRPGG